MLAEKHEKARDMEVCVYVCSTGSWRASAILG